MHARTERQPLPKLNFSLPRLTRGRIFVGLACLLGGAIAVNATLFQTEKHPAPMFRQLAKPAPLSTEFPLPPQRPDLREASARETPARETAVREPAARPAASAKASAPAPEAADALVSDIQRELAVRGFFKGEATGKLGPATTKAIRDFQFSQRVAVDGKPSEALLREIMSARATMKDELLDLVKRTGSVDKPARKDAKPETAKVEATKADEEKAARTVADVQRALNKAGYGPLTADGHMGPATKAALAKFEADRKLTVRGEPKGPVLKHLAAASGIKIAQ